MLRNPCKTQVSRVLSLYFPKPCAFFSQNSDKDPKTNKTDKFSLNSAITRLNAYLSAKEAGLLRYFSGFTRKSFETLPKSRILLFLMGFLFFGFQVKALVKNFEAISQQVLKNSIK